jgi:signal peptidase II
MQKAGSLLDRRRGSLLLLILSLVIAADQLTKAWVSSYPEGDVIFQAAFLRLTHVQNTGGVFGLFQGQSFTLMIVSIVGIIILVLLIVQARRYFPLLATMPGQVALCLLLAGTIGNLIDRIRLGHVTDFIDFGVWPAFNIADSSTVVGEILLGLLLLRWAWREIRHPAQ